MNETGPLTVTNLLAEATEVLVSGGYQLIESGPRSEPFAEHGRVFEDDLGVVAVVAYETWRELSERWVDAQATLVDFVSPHIPRGESKAWDLYMVLLTPGLATASEVMSIRYDTRRVRKLVVTKEDMTALSDIERALLPLLPLAATPIEVGATALEVLPGLLEKKGIDAVNINVLISAFTNEQPLVDELHKYLGGQE